MAYLQGMISIIGLCINLWKLQGWRNITARLHNQTNSICCRKCQEPGIFYPLCAGAGHSIIWNREPIAAKPCSSGCKTRICKFIKQLMIISLQTDSLVWNLPKKSLFSCTTAHAKPNKGAAWNPNKSLLAGYNIDNK